LAEGYDSRKQMIIRDTGPALAEDSELYMRGGGPPLYNRVIFEDIGRAVCVALLDLVDVNPVSRIANSRFRGDLIAIMNEINAGLVEAQNEKEMKLAKKKKKKLKK